MKSPVCISIEKVSFYYGEHRALREVSLDICAGQVLGLVGPNGAGKSTLIELLVGELALQSGRIELASGIDPRQGIGFCPQTDHLWDALSCLEQLMMMGVLYGRSKSGSRERAQRLLRRLGLEGQASKLAGHLSGGMRRRLSLALALVQDPTVVILDEPEAGLDPGSRREFRHLLRHLAHDQHKAVLIATHHLEEIEKLADDVALLHRGELLARGSCETLVEAHCPAYRMSFVVDPAPGEEERAMTDLSDRLASSGLEQIAYQKISDGIQVKGRTTDALALTARLEDWARKPGRMVRALTVNPGDLEEVFLTLTGETYDRYQ